jgi:diphosphomevalonate decarboxylase
MASAIIVETVTSPTNIACIKYWGKASKEYNTPINSSVSVTLDQDDLRAITSVAASKSFTSDRLWLNGSELSMTDLAKNPHAERFLTCVREIRKLARDRVDASGRVVVAAADWDQYHIHVVSRNTFPTAAGLASSAAGYACLVFALAKLLCVPTDEAGLSELSVIARQGSGSACRSLFGGFVKWQMGSAAAGWADSRAVPVAAASDWPELETLILVVNDAKKDTSSTAGMGQSVKTSPLLRFRADSVVDGRLAKIEQAFKAKDFAAFGELTMADSNQFHATCLDTMPPIFYLNDTSRQIMRLVHAFNDFHGAVVAAYTFDAGPNAVIFVPKPLHATLTAFMTHFFPDPTGGRYSNRPDLLAAAAAKASGPEFQKLLAAGAATGRVAKAGDIKMIYCTRIGDGPRHLKDPKDCLLDATTGLPRPLRADETNTGPAAAASSGPSAMEAMVSQLASKMETLLALQRDVLASLKPVRVAYTLVKITVALSTISVGLRLLRSFKKRN